MVVEHIDREEGVSMTRRIAVLSPQLALRVFAWIGPSPTFQQQPMPFQLKCQAAPRDDRGRSSSGGPAHG